MIEGTSSNRQRLSSAQRALLDERLRGRKVKPEAQSAPRDPEAPVPLTPLQAQIWALAQSHPQVAAYNMHRALRFTGNLDIAALRNAIAVLVNRHEALRTVFAIRGREIVQIVRPQVDIELQIESPDNSMIRAEAELRKPFDLASGPLIRFLLLEEAPNRHVFLVAVHHIVADEWSLDICLTELNMAYNGQEIEVESPSQYSDYALQKLADIDRNSATHVEFWRDRLTDIEHSIQLPFDYTRPPTQTFDGDFLRVAIDTALMERLVALAARFDVTPFVLMYTAYAVMLARLSGQTRFAVGVPSANRLGGGTETAIGLFVASLPLPCRIDHDNTFVHCLEASRDSFLDAMMNLDFAFDDLLSAIACERKRNGNPLFQTMFVQETDSLETLDWSELEAERVELNGGCSKFDLTIFVDPNTRTPTVAVEFNTALFAATTARRIISSYVQVLEAIVIDPDVTVGRIDILPTAMRRQLLSDFGSGLALEVPDHPRAKTIPGQILQTAESTPDAVALVFDDQRLTYRELVDEAGRLAARLRACGIGAGDMVGIFMDRSLHQLIGVLGVQLAGSAYVPLDPGYPEERLNIIFEDLAESTSGGMPHVVTTAELAARLRSDIAVVLIDSDDASTLAPISAVDINPSSPAYVIYTSGSTGRPKGVVVTHANLLASTAARHQYYDLPKHYLLVPSFAFDSSVAGIFWTLSCGGTLVIPSTSDCRDPVALGRIISAAGITHTLMLPSLWQWVLLRHTVEQFQSLETTIVAGEACSQELVDLHHAMLPDVRLYNEYGPTEATVWASVHECSADVTAATSVPIGRPIAGSHLYVLDQRLNLVPVGVTGELYIGGAGVAAGYLQRPEETAARFVSDPFVAGEVVYRTGDLVRWHQDGALEFVGRADSQLKLRGYRIEPTEIEARLCAHSDVLESGVTILADDSVDDVDIQRTFELAKRLPASLVEKLLLQVENGEDSP